ncbi:MAG: ABC transporter permease [Oscillospiraceae bacterium]|nr:ABC transporter permease [Oscillospiraceae bacterium]
MKLKKLKFTDEKVFDTVKTMVSVVIALGITFIVLALVSDDPFDSFTTMLSAPLTKVRYIGDVIEQAVPLVFAGLACSLLFRTNLFNLGSEGIFYIGGVLTAYLASEVAIASGVVHPLVCVLATGLFGGLLMLIPGFLKAKFNTNELVSSLMLNSIYLGVGMWFLRDYMQAPDYANFGSKLLLDTAKLPPLIENTNVTVSAFVAVAAVVLIYIFLYKTRTGFQVRMIGFNASFARYAGMNAFSLFLLVHFISGLLSGIGTSLQVISMYDRFVWAALPGLGFTGALVTMMAKNNPIAIFFVAFGISYLNVGAEIMSRNSDVPVEIISIVQAILVLLISSQYFLRALREKQLLKEGMADGKRA